MGAKTNFLNTLRLFFKQRRTENWLRNKIISNPNNSILPKLAPNNYQYKKNSFRTFLHKDAVKLRVDISDYVGHYLYFGFQDIGQEALYDLVKKGDTVLDIGTNIGSTLLMLASKVQAEGKVYGFEPDGFNYENCLQNIKLNDFSNILVSQIGLGDTVGSFDLVVDTESNRGGNRISLKETNKSVTKIEVNTLDNWIQENNISKVDVIKIDVEGFEYRALIGGENLLKEHHPILFIELDDENLKAVGDTASSLVELLEKLDYEVYNSIDNDRIHSSDDFSNCHYDIIAKPK